MQETFNTPDNNFIEISGVVSENFLSSGTTKNNTNYCKFTLITKTYRGSFKTAVEIWDLGNIDPKTLVNRQVKINGSLKLRKKLSDGSFYHAINATDISLVE